jgi:L-Ala-D/L-Glu epimerase
MSAPTTIRAIDARSLDLPLVAPFGISGGSLARACNVLVAVDLADGTRGLGEAAPFPAFNGETQEGVLSALSSMGKELIGADVRAWRKISSAIRQPAVSACARCALEMAVLDAMSRRVGLPLWAWFGGASSKLTTDMTVTTGSVEDAARDARAIAARGMHCIKVKVGSVDPGFDCERVRKIASAAPGSRLLLDGNCGFSVDGAVDLVQKLRANGVEIALFEQPVSSDDWEGLRQVGLRTGVQIVADESVVDSRSALGLLRAGAVQVINVKLMKCGIAEALDIVAIARAFGAKLMIGGMVESILAMSMSACFAVGLGGFAYADLDTPLFMTDQPFDGGFSMSGETIDVSCIEAGHGVKLREG